MRVLVTGASGQLAHAVRRIWQDHELILPEESVLDLGKCEAIQAVMAEVRPQVVVNCAAFTQVDRCESEAELAHLINAAAVPPALLICDVVMPKTDGLALTRQLLARLPGLKVLFISGKLADTAWWPADLSGIRLLAKPLDNAELILAVKDALSDSGALT